MKELTIELTKGSPLRFQSLGWKISDAHDYRRQFYALNHKGKPVVVALKPAIPQSYAPFRQAPAVLIGQPFPDAICVEVSPCRLLAPPCFQSQEQLDGQLLFQLKDDRWKRAYVQAHNQVLILQDSADEDLRKKLDSWLLEVGKAYESAKELLCAKVRQVETLPLQDLGFDTEERRTNRLAELQSQLRILESESLIDGIPCRGWQKLTIEDIKKGCAGLRDVWMREDWACRNGWDLEAMRRERFAFRRWLEMNTGTKATIIDATNHPGPKRHGVEPPHLGETFESDPCFLEACASVRFRAHFADNANTVVYLSDCELRQELTTEELEEVGKLNRIDQPVQAQDLVNFRHSPNYRQIFWTHESLEHQASLTNTQANAFAALHNANRFVLSREEWQQEIYGDEPPGDFRPDKIFNYGYGRKVWERFIRVDGDRYRLVFETA